MGWEEIGMVPVLCLNLDLGVEICDRGNFNGGVILRVADQRIIIALCFVFHSHRRRTHREVCGF